MKNWWKSLTSGRAETSAALQQPDLEQTPGAAAAPKLSNGPAVVEGSEPEPSLTLDGLKRSTPEVADVYRSLGFDIGHTDKVLALLDELDDSIRATVPDMNAFRHALQSSADRLLREHFPADAFLTEISAPGLSDEILLKLLNRDPLHERLPFLEKMPARRGSQIVWRTPLNATLPEKRPADLQRFEAALVQLQSLLQPSGSNIRNNAVAPCLDTLFRACRDPQGYLPAPLTRLRESFLESIERGPNPAMRSRRAVADKWCLLYIHLQDGLRNARAKDKRAARESIDPIRELSGQLAELVIRNEWLQRTWFLQRSLVMLLDVEALGQKGNAQLLAAVRREVDQGQFDAVETMNRLKDLERSGVIVSSLTFALLRILAGPVSSYRQAR